MIERQLLVCRVDKFETLTKNETIDGVDYMVLPVIPLVEGVLNGTYYSSESIKNSTPFWNGATVPVNHPVGNVSANSVQFERTTNIGRFYNSRFEGDKLKGDIWIDIKKAESLGYSNILEQFKDGVMMEISTGLYADSKEVKGSFKGVEYNAQIGDIVPDHIALLPNDVGACSVADGCGAMRTHNKGEKMIEEKVKDDLVVATPEPSASPVADKVVNNNMTITAEDYAKFQILVNKQHKEEEMMRDAVRKSLGYSEVVVNDLSASSLEEVYNGIKPQVNNLARAGSAVSDKKVNEHPDILFNKKGGKL